MTNSVPMLIARTPNSAMAVAAWVRFTRLEQNRPKAPNPSAVTMRTT